MVNEAMRAEDSLRLFTEEDLRNCVSYSLIQCYYLDSVASYEIRYRTQAIGYLKLLRDYGINALDIGTLEKKSIRRCKLCGQALSNTGHKDREYCTKKENPECFKKRQRERVNHYRNRRV